MSARRTAGWAAGGLVAVAVVLAAVAGALCARDALAARRQLTAAQQEVTVLRAAVLAGDGAAESAGIARLQAEASAAARDTSGAPWLLRDVPWLGDPLRTVRGAAGAVDQLAHGALPGLVAADRDIAAATRRTSSGIDLTAFAQARPALGRVLTEVAAAQQRVAALPAHTLVGGVNQARSRLLATLSSLHGQLTSAVQAARLLPAMLGQGGPRRYLVVFENESESRGLGGLPAGYAVLTADHGQVRLAAVTNNAFPMPTGPVSVPGLPAGFLAEYAGSAPTRIFVNSDVSPDFPDAARIWLAMWQATRGVGFDGAIVTDPTTLAALLAVTGPASVAGQAPLTEADTVAVMESGLYRTYPAVDAADLALRNAAFEAIGRAAASTVLAAVPTAPLRLAQTFARAAGQGRFLVFSAHPAEEQLLAADPIGGALPAAPSPFLEVVVNNAGGSKLDYYLHRAVTYTAGRCAGRERRSEVTVALTNAAPRSGLPAYVSLRDDAHPPGIPVGQTRLLVSVFATDGAALLSATLGGTPLALQSAVQAGHPVFTADVSIDPGDTATLRLLLQEPTAPGAATVRVQPLVTPQATLVRVPACR